MIFVYILILFVALFYLYILFIEKPLEEGPMERRPKHWTEYPQKEKTRWRAHYVDAEGRAVASPWNPGRQRPSKKFKKDKQMEIRKTKKWK